jgi:hypothetical protein
MHAYGEICTVVRVSLYLAVTTYVHFMDSSVMFYYTSIFGFTNHANMEDRSFFSLYNLQSDKYSYFFQVTDSKKKIHEVLKNPPKLPSLRGLIFCGIYMKNARLCCFFPFCLMLPLFSLHTIEHFMCLASVLYACTLSQRKRSDQVRSLHAKMYVFASVVIQKQVDLAKESSFWPR